VDCPSDVRRASAALVPDIGEVVRKRSIDWYKEALVTRGDDKKATRIVVVMQRVHMEEITREFLSFSGFMLTTFMFLFSMACINPMLIGELSMISAPRG